MTKDEIIEIAVQAGMNREALPLMRNLELLTAFAKLVAHHEREAVIDLVDNYAKNNTDLTDAIRARGQA